MESLVSVIMTTYREEINWIKDSLNSLIQQTYNNIEIIIVIDDPYQENIIQLLKEYQRDFLNIKVVVNKSNLGLANSLNKAFKLAEGNYIARMDADDISKVDRIEKQVEILESNPDVHLISTLCEYINENGNVIGKQSVRYKDYKQVKRGLKHLNFLIHPSWLMRKEVFEKLNGYRNFECSQDYDFLLRLINVNFNIAIYNEELVQYRVRENSLSSGKGFKQYLIAEYIRNLYYERINNKVDSFSLDNLSLFLEEKKYFDENEHQKYSISHGQFMKIRECSNLVAKLNQSLKCMFISKYSRSLLLKAILFKVSTKI